MAAPSNTSHGNFLTRLLGRRLKIFISYRRRFDAASARLLKDELTEAFGGGTVFRDVDDIAVGEAFPESISAAVENCDVFLTLISPGWLGVTDELRDPADFVRREIAAALARDAPVIPVLLGGARMPEPDELPEEIRDLAFRQALELSDGRWDYDVARLVKLVCERAAPSDPPALSGGIVARSLLATWPRRLVAAGLLAAAVWSAYLYNAAVVPPYRGRLMRPAGLSAKYEECLERLRATGTHEATVMAQDDDEPARGTPVVWVDEYKRVSAPPPEGFPILIELYEPGGVREMVFPLGAVSLRFLRGDYPNGGVAFKIDKVIEPPCTEVTDYSNEDSKAKSEVYNWDGLTVRLRGHSYRLRLGDRGDSLTATLTREPRP